VIRKVEPKFPDALQHQGLTATVVLQIVVGASGRIHNARVLRTDGRREFIEAAIDAVRRWEFEPGRKDGKPVDVEATIEINFRE
jgi:protein TonB